MNQFSLIINKLTRRVSSQIAINQLSVSLARGSKVALLGLNGAGKSSLIRLLTGESKPDQGEINYPFKDRRLAPFDHEFKRSLGVQSDTMLSLTQMTGNQYLTLCGQLKSLSGSALRTNLDVIIKQWSMQDIVDKPMAKLSKGNLQKLAIAQAFIGQPKWLFFDEPCQSLDPIEQERFNHNIKQLEDTELCLFSTHNVSHALEIADEILFFHQSQLAFHFTQCQSESESQHAYLMVSRHPERQLTEQAREFNIDLKPLYQYVYQFHHKDTEKVTQLSNSLEKHQSVEFLLNENQAIMPLFRLVASGELSLTNTSSTSRAERTDG